VGPGAATQQVGAARDIGPRNEATRLVSVLLRPKSSGILDEHANLATYVARGEARPAYKWAFDAQLAVCTGKPPAS